MNGNDNQTDLVSGRYITNTHSVDIRTISFTFLETDLLSEAPDGDISPYYRHLRLHNYPQNKFIKWPIFVFLITIIKSCIIF